MYDIACSFLQDVGGNFVIDGLMQVVVGGRDATKDEAAQSFRATLLAAQNKGD